METEELTNLFINKLKEYSCSDIQLINIDDRSKIAQKLIICNASDTLQAKHIANELKEFAKEYTTCLHTDGIIKGEWIVIDYKEIIIHIFTKETRKKFNIEKLWKDYEHIDF